MIISVTGKTICSDDPLRWLYHPKRGTHAILFLLSRCGTKSARRTNPDGSMVMLFLYTVFIVCSQWKDCLYFKGGSPWML